MKKLVTMVLVLTSVLSFSLAMMLPSAFAVGFLLEAVGVTVVSKLISALIALGFWFLGLHPIIA